MGFVGFLNAGKWLRRGHVACDDFAVSLRWNCWNGSWVGFYLFIKLGCILGTSCLTETVNT
jgi:hypothetical protein